VGAWEPLARVRWPGVPASGGTLIVWPHAWHRPDWPAYSSDTSRSVLQCGQGNRIGMEKAPELSRQRGRRNAWLPLLPKHTTQPAGPGRHRSEGRVPFQARSSFAPRAVPNNHSTRSGLSVQDLSKPSVGVRGRCRLPKGGSLLLPCAAAVSPKQENQCGQQQEVAQNSASQHKDEIGPQQTNRQVSRQ
jgi:hypothetical protein